MHPVVRRDSRHVRGVGVPDVWVHVGVPAVA